MKPKWYKHKCKKCGREGWTAGYCTVCGTPDAQKKETDEVIDWLELTAKQVKLGMIHIDTVQVESVEPPHPEYAYLYPKDVRRLTVTYTVREPKRERK